MSTAKFPGPDSQHCVFWHDFETLTADNLWRDRSRNGLHVTPVNFAAPSYGLLRNSKGKGYVTFNGTTQRGIMAAAAMAKFYAVAPTTSCTIVVAAYYRAPAAGDFFLCARDAGGTRGLGLRFLGAEQLDLSGRDAGGLLGLYASDADAAPLTSRVHVTILASTGAISLRWVDGAGRTSTSAGNGNPISYDTAVVPTLGAFEGGFNFFDGNWFFFGLFKDWIPTDQEAKAFTDPLRNGVVL